MAETKKAPADGRYVFNGGLFRTKAGALMPRGAQFIPEGGAIPKLNPGGRRVEDRKAKQAATRETRPSSQSRESRTGQTGATGPTGQSGPPAPPE